MRLCNPSEKSNRSRMHSWSLPILLALALLVLAYLRGWRQLQMSLPSVLPIWRPAAFVAGVLVLAATIASPIAGFDHHFLTAHMLQHLLLMTVACPLILLGAPVITLLHALPVKSAALLHRWTLLRCSIRVVTHPVLCWLAGAAVVIGWHTPALFDLGMSSPLWHSAEQFSFLIGGLLFWWPVVQPWPAVARWPEWSIPAYLFFAALPCDALSAFLCFCNRVVYPHYAAVDPHFAFSPLKDQACAGAVMWVWVTFAYLFPAAAIAFRLLSPEQRFVEEHVA